MTDLPGNDDACWVADAPRTSYPEYAQSDRTEIAVIGAGIVGLTAAYLLAKAGHEVTVVEAMRVGRGVTGRSTAKVTSQHALALTRIARERDHEHARLYAEANQMGTQAIVRLAGELRIDCDLEPRNAYAYSTRATRRASLEREARLAAELGMPAKFVRRAPLPFANEGAVVYTEQAQFNPVKYLIGLARAVREAGGRIFENTRISEVEHKKGAWRVASGRHTLQAERVVSATHMPIGAPLPYDERTQPRCHVAAAFRAKANALDGMFIDVDRGAHSLRMASDDRGPVVIALAPKFATGQIGDVADRLRKLQLWVRARVDVGDIAWRWINEDYDSPDGVPFAGELAKKAPGLYVATGFGGWGISNGTAAAMLIADQVDGRDNAWAALYNPERRARKINEGGDSKTVAQGIDDIAPGTGAVLRHGKNKIAIYKAKNGRVHALSAACTHKGCSVTWNNADSTWNCPCHGSLFTCDGEVLHGPATEPLAKVQVPKS